MNGMMLYCCTKPKSNKIRDLFKVKPYGTVMQGIMTKKKLTNFELMMLYIHGMLILFLFLPLFITTNLR